LTNFRILFLVHVLVTWMVCSEALKDQELAFRFVYCDYDTSY